MSETNTAPPPPPPYSLFPPDANAPPPPPSPPRVPPVPRPVMAPLFTADAVVALLGLNSAGNAAAFQHPAPPPLQPPPFVANSAAPGTNSAASAASNTPGTSLFARFPQIEEAVILEITRHLFLPTNLYKLDPPTRDRGLERRAEFELADGQWTAVPRTASVSLYPNLASVVEPLLQYFEILTTYAATCGGDTAATLSIAHGSFFYIAHLSALNAKYLWPAVLAYHKAFFMVCHQEMKDGNYAGWLSQDDGLKSRHLFGQNRPVNNTSKSSHSDSGASGSSSSRTAGSSLSQTCTKST